MKSIFQKLVIILFLNLLFCQCIAQEWSYLKIKKYFSVNPPSAIEGFYELESDWDRKYLIGIIKINTDFKIFYLAGKMEHWSEGLLKGYIIKKDNKYFASWDEGVKPATISYFDLIIEPTIEGFKLKWPNDTPDLFKKIKLIESDIAFNRYRENIIKMIESGTGVFEISALINNVLKISLILDTGASEVSISPDVALTLFKAKTISENDWLPGKYYQFADGSIGKSDRFIIRNLTIGNFILKDIETSISNSIEAPLLLGQSALKKLGRIQIDYINKEFKILK